MNIMDVFLRLIKQNTKMVYSIIEHTIIVIVHNLLKKHIVGSEKNKKTKKDIDKRKKI